MAAVILAPQLVAAAPVVLNTGTQVFISMPLTNTGGDTAPTVFVTAVSLGAASRMSPQFLPTFVGNLAPGNDGAVNARFSAVGLVVGQKYLLTVRGTYGPSAARTAFTVNRFVTLPAAAPYPVPLLAARAQAVVQPAIWSYTIFNDEPTSSAQNLAGFSMSVAAPVAVTGTPPERGGVGLCGRDRFTRQVVLSSTLARHAGARQQPPPFDAVSTPRPEAP